MLKSDKTLDVHGVTGPKADSVTEQALESMHRGQLLRVITDDHSSKRRIPDLCADRGFQLLEVREEGRTLYFTIQK